MRKKSHRSHKRSQRRSNSDTKKAVAIFSVGALLLGGLLFSFTAAKSEADKIDHDNFCHKDQLPEIVAVLIDHTDSLNTIQKASLETRLWDLAGGVAKNGAIRFFSVDNVSNATLEPNFTLCNPGSEKEVSEFTGNKRQARKRYKEKFANIIQKNLDDILTAKTADESPIMEAVQSVTVTSFLGEKNRSPVKKLILISDLLEHTSKFSLYNGIPDFEDYSKSDHWNAVKANMQGIDIQILYLNRGNDHQNAKLKVFWQMYFLEQGAREVNFSPIEG